MPLETRQADFADAVLNPELPVPEGIVDPAGAPAPKRFAVYRNNVTASLIEALATAFPVIEKIVGDEFFAAMAREFVREHPPTSPLLMFYGEAFPAFLKSFVPVSHLTYLSDVAQLELFRRQAYHAADATPLAPDFVGKIAPDQLGDLKVTLHPSLRLLNAEHPALSIWEWNMAQHESDRPVLPDHGEAILIARPEMTVEMRRLSPGSHRFIATLAAGETFGAAAAACMNDPDFDLTTCMSGFLESRIAIDYSIPGTNHERTDEHTHQSA